MYYWAEIIDMRPRPQHSDLSIYPMEIVGLEIFIKQNEFIKIINLVTDTDHTQLDGMFIQCKRPTPHEPNFSKEYFKNGKISNIECFTSSSHQSRLICSFWNN